ncbi:MAG: L-ribulose-5-phosphate 4-epimerase [Candidatus Limiplasma sp.]|nr:L-ribulose-5-phosphate 4-epimerase [Candidatus Limiplasma sp.]
MLEELKQEVYEANMLLPKFGLTTFTWGNVSGLDRQKGMFVIKPSGVPYEELKAGDMVVMDLEGRKVEGMLNPSTDTLTHMILYRNFQTVGGVVHTHSRYATSWAQSGRDIPAYGTTHADYIYGDVPCCRMLTDGEVDRAYEEESGNVIVEEFRERKLDPAWVPCALLRQHGPFAWGKTPQEAVHHAVVLEQVAHMAILTESIRAAQQPIRMSQHLQDKHHLRKFGPNAYYGQKK